MTRSLGAPRWWDTLEEVEAEREPDPLFSVTETVRPVLDTVEADATPAIADNLAALLRTCPLGYKVVDHTIVGVVPRLVRALGLWSGGGG